MKRNKRLGNEGFTLIEVLLSIAILALITVPLMKYFSEAAKYAAQTSKKQKATLTCQETIEAIKGQTVLVKWQGAPDDTGIKKNHFDLVEDLKSRFSVSDTLTFAQIEAAQPNFQFDTGKGTLTYAFEDRSVWEAGLGVKVILHTDLSNEEVSSPLVYGIDDSKNIIAAEHTEEEDAIVYFINANAAAYMQTHGTYIDGVSSEESSSSLDVYTEETSTSESSSSAESSSESRVIRDDMIELSEDQIRENMSRIVHVTISDNEELSDRYFRVAVKYEYICQNIYGDGTKESYFTPDLINTNILELEGLYFMYNRVSITKDEFEIHWEARQPDELPDFRFVCQNLDEEIEGYDWKNYTVHVTMTTKSTWTESFTPSFRTNLYTEEGNVPISMDFNGSVLEGEGSINVDPLTTSANPVRIFDVTVAVYGSKAEMEADASTNMDKAMIIMKTTKIE